MGNVSGLKPALEDFCEFSKDLQRTGKLVDENDLPRRLIVMLAQAVSDSQFTLTDHRSYFS